MRVLPWLVALSSLVAGFGLGRASRPDADLDDVASFRRSLTEADWVERTRRFSGFLPHLDPENLPEALAVVEENLPWLVTDELRMFMLAWSRFDAPGALAHAQSLSRLYARNASGAAIYAWAFRDPESALVALEAVESEELADFMQKRLVAGWTHGEHRRSATQYIASLPEGPRRFEYLGTLAWELSREGPEPVMQWAEDAPETSPRFKRAVYLKATKTLAALDPAGTAAWLENHLDRSYAGEAPRVLMRSWALNDPEAALAWGTGLPDGEPRERAVSVAFNVWLERWPEDAAAWLLASTPAPGVDPAVRVLVDRHRKDAPAAAMQWALSFDDSTLRGEVLTDVGRSWLARDPGGVRAWLADSDLPDDVRAAILSNGSAIGPGGAQGAASSP